MRYNSFSLDMVATTFNHNGYNHFALAWLQPHSLTIESEIVILAV